MADNEASESGRDTHPSIDLTLHRIRELEADVAELKKDAEQLERTVDRLQDRMKLAVAIVLFLTPVLWKLVDKVWP